MHSYSLLCIIIAVLFNNLECSFGSRSNAMSRQAQQQMYQPYYPQQPVASQFPAAYPMNPYPFASNGLPPNGGLSPENVGVPYRNAAVPPGNAAMPPEYYASGVVPPGSVEFPPLSESLASPAYSPNFVNELLFPSTTSAIAFTSYPESMPFIPSFQNFNPSRDTSNRGKKYVPESKGDLAELFEEGKKLLEISTVSEGLNKAGDLKHANASGADNATLISIPNGVQLKTDSRYNDTKVHATVNITSSTQKSISFDNNTEIENVVEMQVEKEIEDDKGANKGSEEVRIIEKELLKPVVTKERKNSEAHRSKREIFMKRSTTNHRSRRSKIIPDEIPRSKFVYNKLARRFLSVVRRKERVVEPNNLSNPQVMPSFLEANRRGTTEGVKQIRADLYDKGEIDDFMKFFLKQMKLFRKSRENNKNVNQSFKSSCTDKWCNNFKISPHKLKKIQKKIEYPEHMNVIMNLNMTWDSKTKKHAFKPLHKEYTNSTVGLETTTIAPDEFSTQQKTLTVYVHESQETRFLTLVLLFSAMTFLLTFVTLIVPKLCRIIKLSRGRSAVKIYELHDENRTDKMKELKENVCTECYPQLEWQSENGDWLSEKESDFK